MKKTEIIKKVRKAHKEAVSPRCQEILEEILLDTTIIQKVSSDLDTPKIQEISCDP